MRPTLTLTISLLTLPLAAQAQWTHSYPPVEGFDHQIYLEGYELPTLNAGPMDPAPAPDGRQLAFAAKGWLWLLDLESGIARRITDTGGMDSRPEWSPDGASLAFVRDHRSHFTIVMLALDSGEETVLVDSKVINLDPVFSPDGRHVFYASAESGPMELWRVSLATLEREQLSESAQVQRRTTRRRPQIVDPESLLIYLHKQNYHDAIELLNTRTGSRTTLAEEWISTQSDISLSPDGRHLAYTWPNDDDGHDLRLLALADASTSVLLSRGHPLAPQFSYDGEWVYYAEPGKDSRMALRRIRARGGAVEQVAIEKWDWGVVTGSLKIATQIDGQAGPSRLSAVDANGHPLIPETGIVRYEGQNRRVFFYSPGEIELTVPVGAVTVSGVHGFETPEASVQTRVGRGRDNAVTLSLQRVWDPSAHGWFAGDNHFHLNYGGPYNLSPPDILPELRGEAMDVAYVLLANLQNRFLEEELIDWRRSQLPIIEFGQEVRAHYLGHINLLGIDEPFWPWNWGPLYQVYGEADLLNAEALQFARARGGIGGYVHPVAVDDPFSEENLTSVPGMFVADAVLGEVDIIELACLWTSEVGTAKLWHAILNLGIPLAASGGSDVMNDLYRTFAIGATRVYVRPRDGLSAASYLEALKSGRSFTSNGPMLDFRAGGSRPGDVIAAPGEEAAWSLDVYSALAFNRVQIFINGSVVQEFEGNPAPGKKRYEGVVQVPEGGWMTARVVGEGSGWPALEGHLYAESSPVWFFGIGSSAPAAKKQAARDLLRVLDATEQGLQDGYATAPIPNILGQFQRARARLEAVAEN